MNSTFNTSFTFDDFRVSLDNFCDFIPFVSTITMTIGVVQKYLYVPAMEANNSLKGDRYYTHLNNKDFERSWPLFIPGVNFFFAIAFYCSTKTGDAKEEKQVTEGKEAAITERNKDIDNQKLLPEQNIIADERKVAEHEANQQEKSQKNSFQNTSIFSKVTGTGSKTNSLSENTSNSSESTSTSSTNSGSKTTSCSESTSSSTANTTSSTFTDNDNETSSSFESTSTSATEEITSTTESYYVSDEYNLRDSNDMDLQFFLRAMLHQTLQGQASNFYTDDVSDMSNRVEELPSEEDDITTISVKHEKPVENNYLQLATNGVQTYSELIKNKHFLSFNLTK
ncbi:MAG: hypothetical protein H0T62_07715 [Parachlamydiaceae bacterium]|nr:hypothetical protein [Parachlamydiaceae bacterium]